MNMSPDNANRRFHRKDTCIIAQAKMCALLQWKKWHLLDILSKSKVCFQTGSKRILYNTTRLPHALSAKAMYREHLFRSSYATEAHHRRTIHEYSEISLGQKASWEIYDGEIYSCGQVLEREKNQKIFQNLRRACRTEGELTKAQNEPKHILKPSQQEIVHLLLI